MTTEPTPATVKRLFAVSGNRCAFPKCPHNLIEGTKVTGKICHIKARSEKGPRYDPNQSNNERRGFDNLILMCPIHHDLIDDDEDTYTVEKLIELKKKHEAGNNDVNEDDVSMEIVNRLLINMNIETKIEIKNEYQNNGQLANIIVNYLVPDIPIKSTKVSCRMLLNNLERNVTELKGRSEVRGILMSPLYIPMNWEKLYEGVSDYLNVDDSATLLTFYQNITSFNDFLKSAEDYFRERNIKMGMMMLDYGVNKMNRAYDGHIEFILNSNLDSLIERLKVLAE